MAVGDADGSGDAVETLGTGAGWAGGELSVPDGASEIGATAVVAGADAAAPGDTVGKFAS
jgi:hypothetical protein